MGKLGHALTELSDAEVDFRGWFRQEVFWAGHPFGPVTTLSAPYMLFS